MLEKVIPGASADAASFVGAKLGALFKLSVLPLLAFGITWYVSWWIELAQLKQQAATGTYPSNFSWLSIANFLLSIVDSLVSIWWFAKVVNLRLSAANKELENVPIKLSNIAYAALYTLGLALLLVVIASPFYGVITLATGSFGSSSIHLNLSRMSFFAFFVSMACIFVLGFWVFCKYSIALPGVVIGERPHFFKDIWKFSEGESWAVPLRILLWGGIFLVVTSFVILPLVKMSVSSMLPVFDQPTTAAEQIELYIKMSSAFLPIQLLMLLFQVPFYWFLTFLFTEGYLRFKKRQAGIKNAYEAK